MTSSVADETHCAGGAIYFLHIPKTAGTSLISFLDSQYEEAEICPAQLLPELFAIHRESVGGYRLYRGHLWYGLDHYVAAPLRYLTMLRDPLRRTLSWYAHVRRDPNAYRHDRVASGEMSLLDFVTDQETCWDMVNAQTIFLAADLDFSELALDPVGYGQRVIREYAARRNDRALLDVAKRRLENMVFGIAEYSQQSMYLFSHAFGFDPNVPMRRDNVSSGRVAAGGVSEEVLSAINELTMLDRELYAWAVECFSQRFDAMVSSLIVDDAGRRGTLGMAFRGPLQEESFARVRIEILDGLSAGARLSPGSRVRVRIRLHNESSETLASKAPNPIRVAYHWVAASSGGLGVFDGERTSLPSGLRSGESVIMDVGVCAPAVHGLYTLQLRAVQEGVAWFNSTDLRSDFDVLIESES